VAALSLTAALVGAGCMAQDADDETESAAVSTLSQPGRAQAVEEKTGEADQAWWGRSIPWLWGSPFFGGCGCGFGGFGCGFGGCGGCW
jgi:hypothetical protein